MAYIGNQPTIGQYRKLDDISGSFNGSLTAFTMQVGSTNVSAGSVFQLLISLGGVIQNPGTDFTVSGSALTFTTAPTSGLDFFGILMGQPLNTATPGDSTVTGAKIVDGTITGAKLAAGFNYDSGLLFLDDTNNRVGIGETSPNRQLVINGGASEGVIQITNNTSGTAAANGFELIHFTSGETQLLNRENGPMVFRVNDTTEALRIDSSGRLLVGTTSTTANSTVILQGSSSAGHAILRMASDAATPSSGDDLGIISFANSGHTDGALLRGRADGGWSGSSTPTRLEFYTTPSGSTSLVERMRISQNGNVWIGQTSNVNTARLEVTNTGGNTVICTSVDSTSSRTHLAFANANGIVGTINTSASSTSYNTSSDYRLKENVVPLTGAADRVNQLQVHRFNFIADPDRTVDGFVAHEAQAVVPECVTGEKDAVDDDGNPVYQGIDQSKLVPLLTAALQEALAEIESLKARVTALEP